jgi:two-component system, chemotaxis family, CheB/CheR fusion protein
VLNDVTRFHKLEDDLQSSSQELETAMEELQSTNEELETTNEELQSTNEELETTNEELQSTNEELETMNEELQSTNEELQTVNEEARIRTEQAEQVHHLLDSILQGIGVAVCVVGMDLRIQEWNEGSREMWGLRAEEVVGQPFPGLDIGLPVDQLLAPLRRVLAGSAREGVEVDAVNRRGQSFRCRITATSLIGHADAREGVILLMEPVEP